MPLQIKMDEFYVYHMSIVYLLYMHMYLFSIKSLCVFNCLTRMLCLYTMIHNIISMFAIYNYMSSYAIYTCLYICCSKNCDY